MRAYGKAYLDKGTREQLIFRVSPEDQSQFRKFLTSYFAHKNTDGEAPIINGSFNFSGFVSDLAKGMIFININGTTLDIEKQYAIHSRASQNTLFGVIRFIAWAQIGHKPKTEDMYWIIEEIIETYAPRLKHPVTNEMRPVRPGDPRLTTKGMSEMIQGALNELSMQDIPDEVIAAIGPDMKKLWESWYDWRYSQKEKDILFEDEQDISWEEYCEKYPVCEFTGQGGVEGDPLIRMHIVSGGSDIADYEKSWNWIHAKQSIHHMQHADRGGWKGIIKRYPFMKGKIERARAIAMKKGLV